MSRMELLHNTYTEYQDNNYFDITCDYWITMNSWYIFVCIYISDKMKNCTHKKQTKIPKSRNDSKIQSKTRRTRGKIVTPKHKNIWQLTFPGLVFVLVVFVLCCQFILIAPVVFSNIYLVHIDTGTSIKSGGGVKLVFSTFFLCKKIIIKRRIHLSSAEEQMYIVCNYGIIMVYEYYRI